MYTIEIDSEGALSCCSWTTPVHFGPEGLKAASAVPNPGSTVQTLPLVGLLYLCWVSVVDLSYRCGHPAGTRMEEEEMKTFASAVAVIMAIAITPIASAADMARPCCKNCQWSL